MRKLAILAAFAAAACVSSSKYELKEKEASDLDAKTKELAAQVGALEKKNAELQAQVTKLAEQRQQLEVKTASLEAKSAEYERLTQSLQGQIQKGEIELSELKGKMMVKLKDKILFPSGSASLNKDGKAALDAVAEVFAGLKDKNIVVAGYTDDVKLGKGTRFADNWELSTARANAVVRYLASKGVDPKMLGAAGFSEYRPVAPNDTPDGRSQNRRIEIALTAADYQPPEVSAPSKM